LTQLVNRWRARSDASRVLAAADTLRPLLCTTVMTGIEARR